MTNRRQAIAFVASLSGTGLSSAQTSDFPSKQIRITSPYSAGIGPDVLARGIGERLAKVWAQPFIVDARPGANGFIALQALKRMPADGHELGLVGNAHMTINPSLFKSIPYDAKADFAPIAMLYTTPYLIAVSAKSKFRNLSELISNAKANPGKVSYGSPYVGSPGHLGAALMETVTDTKMIHIPFKDMMQIYTSVASGDVDWAFGTSASMAALLQAGKLKLLAASVPKRLDAYTELPTVDEALGLKGFEVNAWVAVIAPKSIPDAVARKINADINRVLDMPETKQQLAQIGFVGARESIEGLSGIIDVDLKRYGELIRKTGISTE